MWKFLYTIYDSVLQEHAAPFMANNDQHALRMFERATADADKSGFGSDFHLIRLCKFHTGNGHIEGVYQQEVKLVPKDPEKDLFSEE